MVDSVANKRRFRFAICQITKSQILYHKCLDGRIDPLFVPIVLRNVKIIRSTFKTPDF